MERGDDDLEPVSPERNSLPPDDAYSDQEQEEDEGAGEDEDDDARSEGSEPEEEEEEMEDEEEGEEEMEDDGEGRGGAHGVCPSGVCADVFLPACSRINLRAERK